MILKQTCIWVEHLTSPNANPYPTNGVNLKIPPHSQKVKAPHHRTLGWSVLKFRLNSKDGRQRKGAAGGTHQVHVR